MLAGYIVAVALDSKSFDFDHGRALSQQGCLYTNVGVQSNDYQYYQFDAWAVSRGQVALLTPERGYAVAGLRIGKSRGALPSR